MSWQGSLTGSLTCASSGLPGPRANLELAQAVADLGDLALFERFAGSADEYLALCGCAGLGRLAAEGRLDLLPVLRRLASDGRWRVREGVVMGLQRLGDADMQTLLTEMEAWAEGTPLEQRAAVAALCEPRLPPQACPRPAAPGVGRPPGVVVSEGVDLIRPGHRRTTLGLSLDRNWTNCRRFNLSPTC